MVKVPYGVAFGDFLIYITQGNHCFRWDILDALDRESLYCGHEDSIARAVSQAFDWIDTNADYLEE